MFGVQKLINILLIFFHNIRTCLLCDFIPFPDTGAGFGDVKRTLLKFNGRINILCALHEFGEWKSKDRNETYNFVNNVCGIIKVSHLKYFGSNQGGSVVACR